MKRGFTIPKLKARSDKENTLATNADIAGSKGPKSLLLVGSKGLNNCDVEAAKTSNPCKPLDEACMGSFNYYECDECPCPILTWDDAYDAPEATTNIKIQIELVETAPMNNLATESTMHLKAAASPLRRSQRRDSATYADQQSLISSIDNLSIVNCRNSPVQEMVIFEECRQQSVLTWNPEEQQDFSWLDCTEELISLNGEASSRIVEECSPAMDWLDENGSSPVALSAAGAIDDTASAVVAQSQEAAPPPLRRSQRRCSVGSSSSNSTAAAHKKLPAAARKKAVPVMADLTATDGHDNSDTLVADGAIGYEAEELAVAKVKTVVKRSQRRASIALSSHEDANNTHAHGVTPAKPKKKCCDIVSPAPATDQMQSAVQVHSPGNYDLDDLPQSILSWDPLDNNYDVDDITASHTAATATPELRCVAGSSSRCESFESFESWLSKMSERAAEGEGDRACSSASEAVVAVLCLCQRCDCDSDALCAEDCERLYHAAEGVMAALTQLQAQAGHTDKVLSPTTSTSSSSSCSSSSPACNHEKGKGRVVFRHADGSAVLSPPRDHQNSSDLLRSQVHTTSARLCSFLIAVGKMHELLVCHSRVWARFHRELSAAVSNTQEFQRQLSATRHKLASPVDITSLSLLLSEVDALDSRGGQESESVSVARARASWGMAAVLRAELRWLLDPPAPSPSVPGIASEQHNRHNTSSSTSNDSGNDDNSGSAQRSGFHDIITAEVASAAGALPVHNLLTDSALDMLSLRAHDLRLFTRRTLAGKSVAYKDHSVTILNEMPCSSLVARALAQIQAAAELSEQCGAGTLDCAITHMMTHSAPYHSCVLSALQIIMACTCGAQYLVQLFHTMEGAQLVQRHADRWHGIQQQAGALQACAVKGDKHWALLSRPMDNLLQFLTGPCTVLSAACATTCLQWLRGAHTHQLGLQQSTKDASNNQDQELMLLVDYAEEREHCTLIFDFPVVKLKQ